MDEASLHVALLLSKFLFLFQDIRCIYGYTCSLGVNVFSRLHTPPVPYHPHLSHGWNKIYHNVRYRRLYNVLTPKVEQYPDYHVTPAWYQLQHHVTSARYQMPKGDLVVLTEALRPGKGFIWQCCQQLPTPHNLVETSVSAHART